MNIVNIETITLVSYCGLRILFSLYYFFVFKN